MNAYYEAAESGVSVPFEVGELKARRRTFPRGVILIQEGDATDSLYIVESGKVKVFSTDEQGNEIIFNVKGPGSYFGEMAALDGAARSASVETLERCQIAIIPRSEFARVLSEQPSLLLELARCMARRIRALTRTVKSLALVDVYGRVARTLLTFAKERDGQLWVEGMTNRDLASMVGASREMVCRIMKDLVAQGSIRRVGRRIIILKSFCESC